MLVLSKAPFPIRFARQQWRAWIETCVASRNLRGSSDSPASNGGRGLKQAGAHGLGELQRDSPASNGGRGLKRVGMQKRKGCGKIRPPAMADVD